MLGPILFNINSADLLPLFPTNHYFKYADDAYLIIPSTNTHTITAELAHHASWAATCNLKLNPTKTTEMVVTRKGIKPPPSLPSISRVDSMKILGVHVDKYLKFNEHVSTTITSCSQSLFALRTIKNHGLPLPSVQAVFRATLISKLLYASPAWWGFTSTGIRDMIEGFLRRSRKLQYCDQSSPDAAALVSRADTILFKSVTCNPAHILHQLLPPTRNLSYNLRTRSHNFHLPRKDDRNFINRMLFANIY